MAAPRKRTRATTPSPPSAAPTAHPPTLPLAARDEHPERKTIRQFRLTVVEGPGAGTTWTSSGEACSIGSAEGNDLLIAHPNVSRFHCEIRLGPRGAEIRDLDSRNGTRIDGVRVRDAFVRSGSLIQIAQRVALRFELGTRTNRVPLSAEPRFGRLVSTSIPMRAAFAQLERAAASDATVLIEGETGVGKTEAARAVHEASARRGGPFVVIDCGVIPHNLVESELFGHERGAFTGAHERRIGKFEAAAGGTVFLDEIGELPAELQPRLLRVLESRELCRVGSNAAIRADVRVIAATNRDLRAEVNAGRLRQDLYYRLAVLQITLPPLRERPEDIPAILDTILASLKPRPEIAAALRAPASIERLLHAAWPGNVRELRAHLERCVVWGDPEWPMEGPAAIEPIGVDTELPFKEARQRAVEDFERRYVEALLRRHDGCVTDAARAAGVARGYLHRLLRRRPRG